MTVLKVSDTFDPVTMEAKQVVDAFYDSSEASDLPTAGIATGSLGFEVDTGKITAFNEVSGEWVEETTIQS